MEIPLGDLAAAVQGTLEGGAPDARVRGVAALDEAGPDEIAFLNNPKYLALARGTRAAAVVVGRDDPPLGRPAIRVASPDFAMARIAALFAPPSPSPPAGVHPTAVVHPSAAIDPSAAVGPHAVIEADCRVGPGTVVGAGVFLGAQTVVGEDCLFYPRVVLRERTRVGNRVILHSGVVVGADGFGYATRDGIHHKIPQLGFVQIDDDVEIGANTTVDRARFGRTWIQRGVKIDNLVQVAHNVVIGEHSLIVAQTGLAGSARLGRHVVMAGQTAVLGHLTVGDRTRVGGRGVVTKDAEPDSVLSGAPALPHDKQQRIRALVRKLPQFIAALKELKERMDRLDKAATHDRA